jgi:hypothetical protein
MNRRTLAIQSDYHIAAQFGGAFNTQNDRCLPAPTQTKKRRIFTRSVAIEELLHDLISTEKI